MKKNASKHDPRLLIDGYNLLFQSQLVGTGREPGWLEAARGRLIALLERKLTAVQCKQTRIIFDASKIRSRTQPSFTAASGIVVSFAIDHHEADDLIEEIISSHSHPKNLQVISSDWRIRRRATARKATAIDSEQFLESIESRPDTPSSPNKRKPSKQSPTRRTASADEPQISNDEIAHWLREFGSGDQSGCL